MDKERPKKRRQDYCILNFNTGYLECHHCGRWFDFNGKILPCGIDWAAEVTKAFGRLHRKCRRRSDKGKELVDASDAVQAAAMAFKQSEAERLGITMEEMNQKECWDRAKMPLVIKAEMAKHKIYEYGRM